MIKKFLQISIGVVVVALLVVSILPFVISPRINATTGKVNRPDKQQSSPTFIATSGLTAIAGSNTSTATPTTVVSSSTPAVSTTVPASTPTVSSTALPTPTPTVPLRTGIATLGFFAQLGAGMAATFYGYHFSPGEQVALYWNYQHPGQFVFATVTADGNGAFQYSAATPSDPNLGQGYFAGIGLTSHLLATYTTPEPANIIPTPYSAHSGQQIQILGGGFDAGEQIKLLLEGTQVATGTIDYRGQLTTSFIVPNTATPTNGSNILEAIGQTSGLKVYASYFAVYHLYPVSISPTSGTVGTPVTITGSTFTPGGLLYINWYVGGRYEYNNITTVTASSTGTFTVTVAAPQCPYIPGGPNPCAFIVYDNQAQASSLDMPFPES